ncbi:MAG: sugar ABC transporter permease [Lachnospiraceae bacterium]|nr:sugar ABC transporter permease [Lachnospiraceae bacterium]
MAKTVKENKQPKRRNVDNVAYLFVLPFVVVFLVFSLYPVLRTLYLSFSQYPGYGEPKWTGLANYIRVVKDKYFWQALWNTVRIWSVNIILQLGLAFLLTIIFNDMKYKMRGLGVYRALFYLPNLIAATSVSFLFKTLLDWKTGSLNIMLNELGVNKLLAWLSENVSWIDLEVPLNWLNDATLTSNSIAVIGAWMWFGNSFILLMAGVQGINKDYFEAAAIDGAGRWTIFAKITMPLLRPIMLYVAVTSLIGGLQMFDIPHLMTQGNAYMHDGPIRTVVMYMYRFGFQTYDVGYAAAIAYCLFFIIAIISVMQVRFLGKEE